MITRQVHENNAFRIEIQFVNDKGKLFTSCYVTRSSLEQPWPRTKVSQLVWIKALISQPEDVDAALLMAAHEAGNIDRRHGYLFPD
jgi:hypothetical protein